MSAINSLTCHAAHKSGCRRRPATSQVGKGPQAVIIDPATGTIYAANFVDSTVSVINPAGCDAATTRGCRHEAPTAAAGPARTPSPSTATNTIYVANGGGISGSGNSVSVINAATCNTWRRTGCARPVATIHVGATPDGIAIDPATAPSTSPTAPPDTVSVINAATCNAHQHSGCGQTPPTINVGTGPAGIAVTRPPARSTSPTRALPQGRHSLGDQRRHLQRPPALRLRPGPSHDHRRHRPGRDGHRPGHRYRLRHQFGRLRRGHRLGDQRRDLQRRPALRLRADPGSSHRRPRPMGHRRRPGRQHHLRGQQQRRRRPSQPFGHQRGDLRRPTPPDAARPPRPSPVSAAPPTASPSTGHPHRLHSQRPRRHRVGRQRRPRQPPPLRRLPRVAVGSLPEASPSTCDYHTIYVTTHSTAHLGPARTASPRSGHGRIRHLRAEPRPIRDIAAQPASTSLPL